VCQQEESCRCTVSKRKFFFSSYESVHTLHTEWPRRGSLHVSNRVSATGGGPESLSSGCCNLPVQCAGAAVLWSVQSAGATSRRISARCSHATSGQLAADSSSPAIHKHASTNARQPGARSSCPPWVLGAPLQASPRRRRSWYGSW
jgi:hypothetical protein